MFTGEELDRYGRQIMIPQIGEKGQEKLKKAKVFIAGAGGLGSPVSIYLTAAGIGHLRMVDHDKVDLTNLNRQIAHWTADVGRKKVESAQEKLNKLNPNVTVETLSVTISEENAAELVAGFDLIVDAMDNLPTRYLLNKTAIEHGVPFVHGPWAVVAYSVLGCVVVVLLGMRLGFHDLKQATVAAFRAHDERDERRVLNLTHDLGRMIDDRVEAMATDLRSEIAAVREKADEALAAAGRRSVDVIDVDRGSGGGP